MSAPTWAIGFVTIERPLSAQRFVRSARSEFPDVPIIVADQSRTLEFMSEFYAAHQVTVVHMPFDAGLSASRNALVESIDVDYLALCDDDFVLGPTTRFSDAIHVLEADPQLGVVGGLLHDYDGATERIRNWEMYFDLDASQGRFTATPIYCYPSDIRQVADQDVYSCDAVLNFAVFRMEVFTSGVRWEERIKVNGEHEDFYLYLKYRTSWKVALMPAMSALHWHVARRGEYSRLRDRVAGRQEFLSKWRLRAHLEIGSGTHPLDGTPVHSWFASEQVTSGSTAVAGITHSRLYRAPWTEEGRSPSIATVPASSLHWVDTERATTTDAAPINVVFRYSPEVEEDGDLLLWYRDTRESARDRSGQERAAGVLVRWFTASGHALEWEREVLAIRTGEQGYWQPLLVQLPLWPKRCAYLRFEVRGAGPRRESIATGFLFPQAAPRGDLLAPQVLAWSRTSSPILRGRAAQVPLAEHLQSATRANVNAICVPGRDWAAVDASAMDFLGLMTQEASNPVMLIGAGGNNRPTAIAPLAMPVELLRNPNSVLFAVRANRTKNPIRILQPQWIETEGG